MFLPISSVAELAFQEKTIKNATESPMSRISNNDYVIIYPPYPKPK